MLCTFAEIETLAGRTRSVEVRHHGTGKGISAGGLVELLALAYKYILELKCADE